MAYQIPTDEPAQIRAGDSIKWHKSLANYPATDGWVLSYRLINAAGKIDITAESDGAIFLVSVLPAESAAFAAGDYTWISSVELDGDRYTIEQGAIKVLPDLAAEAAGFDTRTTAKKTLDLMDAALLARGNNAWTESYEIAGRSVKFRTFEEFMKARSQLQREVQAEENANRIAQGLAPKNKIQVRF